MWPDSNPPEESQDAIQTRQQQVLDDAATSIAIAEIDDKNQPLSLNKINYELSVTAANIEEVKRSVAKAEQIHRQTEKKERRLRQERERLVMECHDAWLYPSLRLLQGHEQKINGDAEQAEEYEDHQRALRLHAALMEQALRLQTQFDTDVLQPIQLRRQRLEDTCFTLHVKLLRLQLIQRETEDKLRSIADDHDVNIVAPISLLRHEKANVQQTALVRQSRNTTTTSVDEESDSDSDSAAQNPWSEDTSFSGISSDGSGEDIYCGSTSNDRKERCAAVCADKDVVTEEDGPHTMTEAAVLVGCSVAYLRTCNPHLDNISDTDSLPVGTEIYIPQPEDTESQKSQLGGRNRKTEATRRYPTENVSGQPPSKLPSECIQASHVDVAIDIAAL